MSGRRKAWLTGLALLAALPARAEQACWLPMEARAYDVMMHTLYLAHAAVRCEGLGTGAFQDQTPQQVLDGFLGRNQRIMALDSEFFDIHFERVAGPDWQTAMQQVIDTDSQVLRLSVERRVSETFCTSLRQTLAAVAAGSWEDYVARAEQAAWSARVALTLCTRPAQ